MAETDAAALGSHGSMRRFWQGARGFWRGDTSWYAWGLIGLLVICVSLQTVVQYQLNLWNRDFFNALERRDSSEMWLQTRTLLVLATISIVLAVIAVWGRMSFQRRWRHWLTSRLAAIWIANRKYWILDAKDGEAQLVEYRIAEDARIATDAPIDFMVGLLGSMLSATTFVVVLWNVGGSIDLSRFGLGQAVPGYLVYAAVGYSALTTAAMMRMGGNMTSVIAQKSQAESELKFALADLREHFHLRAVTEAARPDLALTTAVETRLGEVVTQWRHLCGQHMRTTVISHGNSILAPLIGLILCVPNYIHGTMLLGEMTQSAAAFVAVQGAFNWLVDNFPRLADWASSARRVGTLPLSFDRPDMKSIPL
jgi:ABC-type uncharacterized transport system fused permease/ATPase subunit